MTLFEFFKIISWIILPPSVFVLILFFSVYFIKIGKKSISVFLILFVALSFYLLSIEPIRDIILKPLEYKYPFPDINKLNCKAAIVLGSGIYLKSPDENGKPSLKASSLKRAVLAFKIWKKHKIKIVLTGGKPFNNNKYMSEAEVMANFLKNLGVNSKFLILEKNSLNTYQNAKFTKKIIEKNKWKKICLITSASHMPRAVKVFKHFKINVIPVPTDYRTSNIYGYQSFFPQSGNFDESIKGIWEYIGIIFYKFRYGI